MHELQRILQAAGDCQRAGRPAVLATVVRTSGSVYRRPGARMLLTAEGMVGAISGGCLEADILERSRLLLTHHSAPQLVRYDTTASDDIVVGFGLGCNGVVEVLLEPLSGAAAPLLAWLQTCLDGQQPGAIATIFAVENVPDVTPGDRLLRLADGTTTTTIRHPQVAPQIAADLAQTLAQQQTRVQAYPMGADRLEVLLEVVRPPLPLLIFGAGYDAMPVAQLAKYLGWHVTVIDHRPEQLTRDRFPTADALLYAIPDPPRAYQHLLTPQAVAMVMTHRYLSDLVFLKTLVPSPLRYLGVLGPRRRMQQLWQDLADQGISPTAAQLQRVYAPVGLDIGAETPEEIALALLAEIQAALGGRSGRHLRNHTGSIHTPAEAPCLALAS
jgi:xanthine/CO dehydrogenase XdhC/CoxF family maturation factor